MDKYKSALYQEVREEFKRTGRKAKGIEFHWFPWCTGHYIKSFCDTKIAELKEEGRYPDIRTVRGQIQILMGIDPDTGYSADLHDLEETGHWPPKEM